MAYGTYTTRGQQVGHFATKAEAESASRAAWNKNGEYLRVEVADAEPEDMPGRGLIY